MDVDSENVTLNFHLVSNCNPSEDGGGTPIFLSPDFVVDKDKINEEFYFGSFDFFNSILSSQKGRDLLINSQGAVGKTIPNAWERIKKIWRLEDAKQYNISNALNIAYANEYGVNFPSLRNNLRSFIDSTFSPNKNLRTELSKAISKNPKEFSKFLLYYQLNLRALHRRSAFEIFSDYFDNYRAFSQIFAYVRNDLTLPSNAKATSLNFDEIKSFYAKSYEFYAGGVCIFTCLNNIIEGRDFDKLQNISLTAYLGTDKAKRRMSFSNNKVFSDASSEFDSRIRNASFHNWFFMLDDKETIELRSGGTGAIEKTTYTQYLRQCVLIFSQICQLISFELLLDELACKNALVTR